MADTLVLNLYAGPGCGKSTTAAFTFAKLKMAGINAELVSEYAKDLTWEERVGALRCQHLVFGKQTFKVERLLGKVDVVVTDSPIMLCTVYGARHGDNFCNAVKDVHDGWNTLDIFLEREPEIHKYNPKGRSQTEEEAMALDAAILGMLFKYKIPFYKEPVRPEGKQADYIVDRIEDRLQDQQNSEELNGYYQTSR